MIKFNEDQICDMVKVYEGQAFVRSSYTPFIIDKEGKPIRYFKDNSGNMQFEEYGGEGENIARFDIVDFVERYGSTSDIYEFDELGLWYDNGDYEEGKHLESHQIVRLVNNA